MTCFTRKRYCLKQGNPYGCPEATDLHARQGKRRSHLHLKPLQIQYCKECNEPVLPHRVCTNCGYYQGKEVVAMEEEK